VGVFGVGQFNVVVEISLRSTLVTTVTKWWFSSTKLAKTRLIQEIELRMLHQTGVFKVRQFSDVVEIYLRLSPLLLWKFKDKIRHNSANIRQNHEYCTKQRVIEVRQFNANAEIYIRPIPVAMATKIWEFSQKNGQNSANSRNRATNVAPNGVFEGILTQNWLELGQYKR